MDWSHYLWIIVMFLLAKHMFLYMLTQWLNAKYIFWWTIPLSMKWVQNLKYWLLIVINPRYLVITLIKDISHTFKIALS